MPSGCSEPCPRVNFARPGGPSFARARPEDPGRRMARLQVPEHLRPNWEAPAAPPSHLQRTCPRRPQPG